MDVIQTADTSQAFRFSLKAAKPDDQVTVVHAAGASSVLVGTYAITTGCSHVAAFSIDIEPDSGTNIARNVSISSLPQPAEGGLPPSSLGWTREEAMGVRSRLSAWAEEWDDPAMDEYNIYL